MYLSKQWQQGKRRMKIEYQIHNCIELPLRESRDFMNARVSLDSTVQPREYGIIFVCYSITCHKDEALLIDLAAATAAVRTNDHL